MKKILVILMMVLSCMTNMTAQYKMNVKLNDGSIIDYFVEDIQEITWTYDEEVMDDSILINATTYGGMTKSMIISGNWSKELVWSEDDLFYIGENDFRLISGAGCSTGTFKGKAPKDGVYEICYPSSYDGNSFPLHQYYYEGGLKDIPMTGSVVISNGQATGLVEFKPIGGLLSIKVTSENSEVMKRISIEANELPGKIILDCGNGVKLTEESFFYILMPEGTYKGVAIEMENIDGKICIKKLAETKELPVMRGAITQITFSSAEFVEK